MAPTTRIQLATLPEWTSAVGTVLAAAGLQHHDQAAVGVSFAPGRVVLPTVDAWAVESRPHVLVAVRDHSIEIGPWVMPGLGPCARCVAADTLDVGDAAAPPQIDPGFLAMAAGWVAREHAAWLRAQTPATWGTSWRLDSRPAPPSRTWQRHPYCGCTWFESA